MEIFFDGANLKDIEELNSVGIINGVTTNPTILSKEKIQVKEVINLCKNLNLKIFVQTIEDDYLKIFEEGKNYYSIYPQGLILKIPFSKEGLKSLSLFKKENIPFSITSIFSLSQIILSLKYEPLYIIPYINRIGRYGGDAINIVRDAKTIIKDNKLNTKILSASFRSSKEVEEVIKNGSDAITIQKSIFDEIFENPLTLKAIEDFKKSYKF